MKKTVKWEAAGECPKCGAPIFVKADSLRSDDPPQPVHTCSCRFSFHGNIPAATPFIGGPFVPGNQRDPFTPAVGPVIPLTPGNDTGGNGTAMPYNPWGLPGNVMRHWGTQTVTTGKGHISSVTLLQERDRHPWSYTK